MHPEPGHNGAVPAHRPAPPSSRNVLRSAGLALVVLLVAMGCGGDDNGDLEAFCSAVRDDNVGVPHPDGSEPPASDFDELASTAPPEVRAAVAQLGNTAADLSEISELDELFAAAFDPEAQAARQTFDAFLVENCGMDAAELPSGDLPAEGALQRDLTSFVQSNYSEDAWVAKVRYDLVMRAEVLDGVEVTFVVQPDDDEAVAACQAASVWLYVIQQAGGAVEVFDEEELIIAERSDSEASCAVTATS